MKKATLSFIILFIAVLLAPQSAQGVEEDLVKQTLRITKHTKDVNQTCPKDTQKYFVVKAFIRKGSPGHFGQNAHARILLTSGVRLKSTGDVVSPKFREADFFFYPRNRGAKVKLSSPKNRITVATSSKDAKVVVRALDSDCLEKGR